MKRFPATEKVRAKANSATGFRGSGISASVINSLATAPATAPDSH